MHPRLAGPFIPMTLTKSVSSKKRRVFRRAQEGSQWEGPRQEWRVICDRPGRSAKKVCQTTFSATIVRVTMTTSPFVQRCLELAAASGCGQSGDCSPAPEASDSESLIGFFQLFRPDGQSLQGLFDSVDRGDQLYDRLDDVFQAAGDDRRPAGGRDAYFIVRSPGTLSVELAEHHGLTWIDGLRQLAEAVGDQQSTDKLSDPPKIRILEGIPPKHPKQPNERSSLLKVILNRCSELTSKVPEVDPHAELLRPAYYFIACDAMLRDYLMWPFYASQTGLADPLRSYFALWSHGVKFRIFREDQVDLYLPRVTTALRGS
jgi:hypothetical protein